MPRIWRAGLFAGGMLAAELALSVFWPMAASSDGGRTAALAATFLIEVCVAVAGIAAVVWLAQLVFYTRGRGHVLLTLWHLLEVIAAHVLGQSALSYLVWKAGALAGDYSMYSHTGNVTSGYAAYDLLVYTALMVTGGGIVDNEPLHEAARVLIAVQLVWNNVTIVIILAAAVATLTAHTDTETEKMVK